MIGGRGFLLLHHLILYQILSNFEQIEQIEQLAQTKIQDNAQNLLRLLVATPPIYIYIKYLHNISTITLV